MHLILLFLACAEHTGLSGPVSTARVATDWSATTGPGGAAQIVAGDFDGDGRGDLAVSTARGTVEVFMGSRDDLPALPDRVLTGGADFGHSLGVLDWNGDGRDDLMVGDAISEGWVYGHRGTEFGLEELPLWVMKGELYGAGPNFGAVLAGGDLDGDGLDEIAVTGGDGVSIFAGEESPSLERERLLVGGPSLGAALAIGDITGDGRAELVIGEPEAGADVPSRGRVEVWQGAELTSMSLLWERDGASAWARYGSAVAVSDTDADGYGDLWIGHPGTTKVPVERMGGLDEHPGGPGGPGPRRWTLEPNVSGVVQAGVRLGGGLDTSGDGYPEMVVITGAQDALLLYGAADGPQPWPGLLIEDVSAATMVPDLSVDGLDEIALGWEVLGRAELLRGRRLMFDADGDGSTNARDCQVDDAMVHPLSPEVCDAVDDDCDGDLVADFSDQDRDGLPDCVDPDHDTDFSAVLVGISGLGAGVALGDVDGDRRDDLAAVSPGLSVGAGGEGAAIWWSTPAWRSSGVLWGGAAGESVAHVALGDVDGDGDADLVLGGTRRVRVHLAGPDGLAVEPAWTVSAAASALLLADVDLDGRADLMVGEAGASRVRLWHGTDAGVAPAAALERFGDGLGGSLAVGDLDADGWPDLAVGAPDAAAGAGGGLFLFGGPAGFLREAPLEGARAGAQLGAALAVGDVDGDGLDDLAVGAPGGDRVVLMRAAPGGPVFVGTKVLPSSASARVAFGTALAFADQNADGRDELLVGAPASPEGAVLMYAGGEAGPTAWVTHAYRGGSGFGRALTTGNTGLDRREEVAIGGDSGVWIASGTTDLDRDGLGDTREAELGLDPTRADTDGDGLQDGDEVGAVGDAVDTDGDGLVDPLDPDADDDGLRDGVDNCWRVVNPGQEDADRDGLGDACDDRFDPIDTAEAVDTCILGVGEEWRDLGVTVRDVGVSSGFQDTFLGHRNRGRSLVAADFDDDGRVDFFVGNPGDPSFVIRNISDGAPAFEHVQTLLDDSLAWGAAAADYDNDGDLDLFVSNGGNECLEADALFRNRLVEDGVLSFEDVTEEAGVGGVVTGLGLVERASANAVWGDYDRDGDQDLFVNSNKFTACGVFGGELSRNVLWENQGDGTFTEVASERGLAELRLATRHSAWVDIDNDGDLDLYENDYRANNTLWINQLVESGEPMFSNGTRAWDGTDDPGAPQNSFAACVEDMNNDGWQDIVVFHRGGEDCDGVPLGAFDDYPEDVVGAGHRLFLNLAGRGFDDVAVPSNLNSRPVSERVGVMGCQLGDLDADGALDVYIGNGGPSRGASDQLFLSAHTSDRMWFVNASPLVDFAALDDGVPLPPYPYRTHGTAMVDVDGDGTLELAVSNGGPAFMEDRVAQEPNRLYAFDWDAPRRAVRVRPVGDGVRVSRDGIGTRATLVVRDPDGVERSVHRTLAGGACFSAQNGFELYLGLGDAEPVSLELLWTDGTVTVVEEGLEAGARLVVTY